MKLRFPRSRMNVYTLRLSSHPLRLLLLKVYSAFSNILPCYIGLKLTVGVFLQSMFICPEHSESFLARCISQCVWGVFVFSSDWLIWKLARNSSSFCYFLFSLSAFSSQLLTLCWGLIWTPADFGSYSPGISATFFFIKLKHFQLVWRHFHLHLSQENFLTLHIRSRLCFDASCNRTASKNHLLPVSESFEYHPLYPVVQQQYLRCNKTCSKISM